MSTTNKSLSKQLAELDEIVAWFEQDDFDIEAAIAKFEAGSKLAEKVLEATINIPPLLYQNQGSVVGVYVARDVDFSKVYALEPR